MYVRLGRYPDDDKERDEDIVIHNYDTWNMDHTLALIIVPLLKQLKATKHGAPCVDNNDVPIPLRMPAEDVLRYKEVGETDKHFFDRWEYVMDEMIWAFERIVDDDDEKQFYSGESDIYWEELENGMSEMKRGPKDTFKIDHEGLRKHNERIGNGLRLFGKYYRSLWD